MTPDERLLLLTTARVLRAQIKAKPHMIKLDMDDVRYLGEALKPFDETAPAAEEPRR